MANITSPTYIPNALNAEKPTARELCPFQHQMLWEPTLNSESVILWEAFGGGGGYSNEDKTIDLSWSTFPNGISMSASGLVSGIPEMLNTYHEVMLYSSSKYEAKEKANIPGQFTGFDLVGNEYVKDGMIAYHTDNPGGPLTEFHYTVGLLTQWITPAGVPAISYTSKPHIIKVVPNNDPAAIAIMYGNDHNNLTDDDGNKLTGDEYIEWRKSQGHNLDLTCS